MAALAAAAIVLGCVPAESSRYRGTMTRSVPPSRTASAEVAGAFGITNGNGTAVNLAAAPD